MSPIEKEAGKLFDNLKKAFEQRHKQSREKAELLEREIARLLERQKSDRYYQSLIVGGQRPPDVMTETVVDRSAYTFKTPQAGHIIRTLAEHQYLQWLRGRKKPIREPESKRPRQEDIAIFLLAQEKAGGKKITPRLIKQIAPHFGWSPESARKEVTAFINIYRGDDVAAPKWLAQYLDPVETAIDRLLEAFPIGEK